MHEFGMVDDFIHLLMKRSRPPMAGEAPLRILYGPGLKEEYLEQAFKVHTVGTPLEKIKIEFVKRITPIACGCGDDLSKQAWESDIPYAICQRCQQVVPISGFDVLECLEIGQAEDPNVDSDAQRLYGT